MGNFRFQVINHNPASPVRDQIVNTFYLQSSVLTINEDLDQLCTDAAVLWRTNVAHFGTITVRAYDMADPLPRRPKAEESATITATTQFMPLEVACCLSFYAGSNTPRRRGRLYLGPWPAAEVGLKPPASVITKCNNIADGLANLGGADISWQQYSPTNDEFHKVSNVWVDNEWDTVRSRGRIADVRNARALEG
jgi:hypothetical protein